MVSWMDFLANVLFIATGFPQFAEFKGMEFSRIELVPTKYGNFHDRKSV